MAKVKRPAKKPTTKKRATKKPSKPTRSAGAFAADPGFAVVGDGNWIPPQDYLVCYVLFASAPEESRRTDLLVGVPRLLRPSIAWSGRLLRVGSQLEMSYLDDRKAATFVRRQYKAGKPVKLSRAQQRELSGDDFDPKVLPAAMDAIADFGNDAPWALFYADLHAWLVRAHAKHAIQLFIRPTLDGDLTDLHRTGVESLFELSLDDVAAFGKERWIRDFLQEVVLHASRAKLDGLRAAKLVAPLRHAFGIDRYADGAKRVLLALSADDRTHFIEALPVTEALHLLLRSDYVADLCRLPGTPELVERTFARFWQSSPNAEAIGSAAFLIQYAVFPAGDVAALCDVLADEVVEHQDVYPRAKLESIPDSLERRGHADAAKRVRAVLA